MDDFREWLSDNLRYILLGLAIIIVLLIAFFAVRFVTDRLGDGGNEIEGTETVSESVPVTETPTEAPTTEALELLQTENQAILDFVTRYYNALAAKDVDQIQNMGASLDDEARQYIQSSPFESYNNIAVYFKNGMTEGSYLVYVYYEVKFVNIDQLVPSLGSIYLTTKEDGTLSVVDPETHTEVMDFMKSKLEDQDVQELAARINSEYNTVVSSNKELAAVIKKYKEPETEVDIPHVDSIDVDVSTSVTVTDHLNVRADSRQDSDQVGSLIPGQVVTRLQVLDNGWSKVRFDDGAGTVVEGYVLSEYLQENGANGSDTAQQ